MGTARADLLFAAAALAVQMVFGRGEKATWLWDASIIAEQTPDIISFSKEQGIDVIFLQMQDEVSDETYRKFIASARQAEIQVHALNGHADWAYRDKQEEGLAFIERIRAYNAASAKMSVLKAFS